MTLYYEKRGNGPILVVSPTLEGDAGYTVDLVDRLVDHYTVVTYDRRGLSRSAMDRRGAGVTMAEHADDLHHLVAGLTDEPVRMLGCGIGAVIGLHLALGHPAQVGALVAHEPVAPPLLPALARGHYERQLAGIQEIHRRDGVAAAFRAVARSFGLSEAPVEPGLTPHPLTPRRVVNFGFLIEHDCTALTQDAVDYAPLRESTVRIVPAYGGATPPTSFAHRCAAELAGLLGIEPVVFPGGHDGGVTHPRAYAARLLDVLGQEGHPA
ncbi:alpha/beta fold hydrolase [Nonomuraea soli]|uniref:Pimeloyl-ACP methyl ester carboxylesterase n=1 Tax=Nonomuraea soli TaxID=1032476 RepID=A0A7W0HN00_9ACTN|nr:alpha/beta hydrolase [Nonomuraea soli]MBA2889267.1 pimeloyl-ACP methyl ester carboxylesterase [Nonomuraea soli]